MHKNIGMKKVEIIISFFLILMVMIVQILFLNVGIMRNVSFVPGATTKSWTFVDDFAEYMTNTSANDTEDGLSIAVMKWDSNEVTVGDIIQFYSEEHDGWYHSVIISKIDPVYGICYAAHTKQHLQRPLSDVYPNGGVTEVRFICPRYDE